MIVHCCDRCGNQIPGENFRARNVGEYGNKELCDPCANGLVDYLKPLPKAVAEAGDVKEEPKPAEPSAT